VGSIASHTPARRGMLFDRARTYGHGGRPSFPSVPPDRLPPVVGDEGSPSATASTASTVLEPHTVSQPLDEHHCTPYCGSHVGSSLISLFLSLGRRGDALTLLHFLDPHAVPAPSIVRSTQSPSPSPR
jgi:hypothetical protein